LRSLSYIASEEVAKVWGGGYIDERVAVPNLDFLSAYKRIWWIRVQPVPGMNYPSTGASPGILNRSLIRPPPDWIVEEEQRFENMRITRYGRQ
jgi:hypothetical protein